MGLSLKQEDMIKYLEEEKDAQEDFKVMLWGVCYADLPVVRDRSAMSVIMQFTLAPGVAATMNNAFCYIGVTDKNFHVIALDSYNTSKVIGRITIPFAAITSFSTKKSIMGGYKVEIVSEGSVGLELKSTSLGTNIKDQKQRLEAFVKEMEVLQNTYPNLKA